MMFLLSCPDEENDGAGRKQPPADRSVVSKRRPPYRTSVLTAHPSQCLQGCQHSGERCAHLQTRPRRGKGTELHMVSACCRVCSDWSVGRRDGSTFLGSGGRLEEDAGVPEGAPVQQHKTFPPVTMATADDWSGWLAGTWNHVPSPPRGGPSSGTQASDVTAECVRIPNVKRRINL